MLKEFPSRIISVILHPLIMPTAGLFLIFNSGSYISMMNDDGRILLYLIVFVGTFLLPLTVIPFFIYRKLINDVQMDNPKERILPLLLTAIFYYLVFYVFTTLPVPEILTAFLLAAMVVVSLTLLITLLWKISAHMMGIGGLTGSLIALSLKLVTDIQFILVFLILAAGLIGFARLNLKAHNPAQIYAGYVTGLITSCLVVYFY
jgi:hypothetical protein